MIAAGTPGNVGVLAQFDVALGSQNEQAPIAPRAQAFGSEPVHADVTESAVAVQHHVAEILKFRVVLVIHVGHLRRRHVRHGRPGVVDELVSLVRAYVAEDAAVARRIPKPIGTGRFIHLVRGQVHGLHHFSDGARVYQFARLHRGPHFQALGVHDGEHAAGLFHRPADLGELRQRGHGRLVAEVVFTVAHHAHAQRRAQIGDGRAGHQLDGGVAQDLVLAGGHLHAGIAFLKAGKRRLIGGMDGHQLAAAAPQRIGDAVDVIVVQADDGEFNGILGLRRRAAGHGDLLRRLRAGLKAHGCSGQPCHQQGSPAYVVRHRIFSWVRMNSHVKPIREPKRLRFVLNDCRLKAGRLARTRASGIDPQVEARRPRRASPRVGTLHAKACWRPTQAPDSM